MLFRSKRGLKLSSTIRLLVTERLSEMEETEQLTRAQEWQRAQAWASWDRRRAGACEVESAAIEEEFERAQGSRRRR